MRIKPFLTVLLVVYLLVSSAAAKRVLFYEISTAPAYTIEGDYGRFAEELRKRGYEVASIEKGELTKDKLENYDILIMQDLNKQLTTQEISAIIWFVLQKGRGLFINGGGQGRANQLTIPFGVTVDNGLLIDTNNPIPGINNRNSFTVDTFVDQTGMGTLRQGVAKVGFYKDAGLLLSGNSKCIATASSYAYSDTGSFAAGSEPCTTAASLWGSGLVLILSDSDMLRNPSPTAKYIDDYNNRNFGVNIVDWLGIATENMTFENSTGDLQLQIKEMKLKNLRYENQIATLTGEKMDLANRYSEVSADLAQAQGELADMKEGMIGPLSKGNWAIVSFGVCIVVASVVISQRKPAEAKIKDEDILSELGYELENAPGATGGSPPKGEGPPPAKPPI